VTVLHEDDLILVVNKPAGVLAQPDHTGDDDVLSLAKDCLFQRGVADPFVGLVHRLDRPTSGLMVLARTSAAARALSKQFRERTVQKRYLAVVQGHLRGIGTWRDYIAKPGRQPKTVSPEDPEGKPAVLDWQALARGEETTLLQVELRTGRPHQIRLQAAERRRPVLGDGRYGATDDGPPGGIALHHTVLRIDPPAGARRATFVADVPENWASFLTDDMNAAIERMLTQARPHG
jgi:tRNA pseudouridine32 synthase/23S rRNA pseudouridine746 synthase/23S rRNA pseudouridine1911/1915/1917 synthase